MRWLILALLLPAAPALAEIRSVEACAAAVAADPEAAREEAALWQRMGGGVAARLCEADALAAMGAHATAAALLGNLAANPNRAMGADLRAVVLADAAEQWLAAERPGLALAALEEADKIAAVDPPRLILRARVEAAEADWPSAQATLEAAIALAPDDALAHALLAAALRQQGDPAAALVEAREAGRLSPDLPETLFETGAALAETGDTAAASPFWLRLIRLYPDTGLAAAARANLQRLN
jgi:tetratricopeptide (TPR) repeat protein